jgi:predicted glycogen debranching enzyme
MADCRDHRGSTHAGGLRMRVEPVAKGIRATAFGDASPLHLLSARAKAMPQDEWNRNYYLSLEAYRGLEALDDDLHVGQLVAELQPGESLTVVASSDDSPNLDGLAVNSERQPYEQRLIIQSVLVDKSDCVWRLVLAADLFIVQRTPGPDTSDQATPSESDDRTVISGCPWFGDWGRDTMVSLPRLAPATGGPEIAAWVLRTFAQFVDQGMLANRFPDEGRVPEYNTADSALWYVEAVRAYRSATRDDKPLNDLFPVLQEIIEWHRRGPRYAIHLDPADGLIWMGEPGAQLTWMDAKVRDWVVTAGSARQWRSMHCGLALCAVWPTSLDA